MYEDHQGHPQLGSIPTLEEGQGPLELRRCPELALVVQLDEGEAVVGMLLHARRPVHPIGRATDGQQARKGEQQEPSESNTLLSHAHRSITMKSPTAQRPGRQDALPPPRMGVEERSVSRAPT